MLHSPDKFNQLLPYGYDGLLDWDYLTSAYQEATKRKIEPMDFDKVVEINGHYLIWETGGPNKELKRGQVTSLLAGWSKGYSTVVFLWCEIVDGAKCMYRPIKAKVYYPKGEIRNYDPITSEKVWRIAYKWAEWANTHKHPFQYHGDGNLDL